MSADFEDVLRIGVNDGVALSDITSIGFAPNGNVLIGDFAVQSGLRVLVVDLGPTTLLVSGFGPHLLG